MGYRDDYRRAESEVYWTLPRVLILLAVVGTALWAIGSFFGFLGATTKVVDEQFGPSALLQKYEWFKNASASLDEKTASIHVYESRFQQLKAAYADAPRSKWSREDREQFNLWASELAGITASYNQLAAEYNAQMAKFNYRFANVGQLPQGASVPLPREYKPYKEN